MNSRRRISDLLRLDRQPTAVGVVCLALTQPFFCSAGGLLWPEAEMGRRRPHSSGAGGAAGRADATGRTEGDPCGLLRFDPKFLDDRPPFLGIGLHQRPQYLWCLSLTRESLITEF